MVGVGRERWLKTQSPCSPTVMFKNETATPSRPLPAILMSGVIEMKTNVIPAKGSQRETLPHSLLAIEHAACRQNIPPFKVTLLVL